MADIKSSVHPRITPIIGYTTASFPSDDDPQPERQPVLLQFPRDVELADALAAAVEAAAIEEGLEFKDLMKLVAAKAPPALPERLEKLPPRGSPGRPAHKWENEYGMKSYRLGLLATVYHALHNSTWAEARRSALKAARAEMGRGVRPPATIVKDAKKLKQAVRGDKANAGGWRRNPDADKWETIGVI